MKKTGIVLLIVGLLITIFTGINFVTKEKVVDVGSVQITRDRNHYLAWPPIVGVVVMLAGGLIYILGSKKQ